MSPKVKRLEEFDHPDLSPFAIHFTGRNGTRTPHVRDEILKATPLQRLGHILIDQAIAAFPMFQTPDPVACFTECTRPAISKLIAERSYAPIGITFRKNTLFQRGGGPALYVRGDAFQEVNAFPPEIRALCTRFWPGSTPEEHEKWSTVPK